jgi:hypothetical protein
MERSPFQILRFAQDDTTDHAFPHPRIGASLITQRVICYPLN